MTVGPGHVSVGALDWFLMKLAEALAPSTPLLANTDQLTVPSGSSEGGEKTLVYEVSVVVPMPLGLG